MGKEEFNGQVSTDSSGAKFTNVKSDYGNLRIAQTPDHKTVSVSIVSVVAPDRSQTIADVVYSTGTAGKPGLEVNDKPAIDIVALGPKLAQAVTQALASGVAVSSEQAHEIGRLTVDINQMAANQRGVSSFR